MADKKTIKIFISQPMKDKTKADILAERLRLKSAIKKDIYPNENIEFINSILDENDLKNSPLWCLGKSIQLLSKADILILAPKYHNARGCRLEKECALEYGITVNVVGYDDNGKLDYYTLSKYLI